MRITWILIAVSVACVFTGLGCGKGPAEQSLKAADEAVQAAQPEIEKYVPEQFRLLTEALEAAHADFDQGKYKAADDAAKTIPGRLEEVKALAQARKDELAMVWNQMGASVNAMLGALATKVSEVSTTHQMPPGMTREDFEAGKAEMTQLIGQWSQAQAAFQGGQVAEATEMGAQVRTQAETLIKRMGIKSAPGSAEPGVPAAPGVS